MKAPNKTVLDALNKININLEKLHKKKIDYKYSSFYNNFQFFQNDKLLFSGSTNDALFFLSGIETAAVIGYNYKVTKPKEKSEVEEYFTDKRLIEIKITDLSSSDIIYYTVKNFKRENGVITFFYRTFINYDVDGFVIKTFEGHAKVEYANSDSIDDIIKEIAFAINEDLLQRYLKNKRRDEDFYKSIFFLTVKDAANFGAYSKYPPKIMYQISLHNEESLE